MPLDFSKLDKLAAAPDAQQADLIAQGFTVVADDKDNPFTGPQAAPQAAQDAPKPPPRDNATPAPQRPPKGPQKPFKSAAGLDYRAFYADLYRWHERYTAAVLQDSSAWDAAAEAWQQVGNKHNAAANPFVMSVLEAAYIEMEREYMATQ